MSSRCAFDVYSSATITVEEGMHMEVKSEPDLDIERSYSSDSTDVEQEVQLTECPSSKDSEQLEDEPLVEIDSISVPQQLVEVDLQPSLILFVNADPKEISNKSKTSLNASGNTLISIKDASQNKISEEEIAIRKSITRALRNVKRKQIKSEINSLPNSHEIAICDNSNKVLVEDDEISLDGTTSSCQTSWDADEEVSFIQPHEKESQSRPNEKRTLTKPKMKQVFDKTKKKRHKKSKIGDNKVQSNKTKAISKRLYNSKKVKILKSDGKENTQSKNLEITETNINNVDIQLPKSIDGEKFRIGLKKKIEKRSNKELKNLMKITQLKPETHLMKPDSFDCTVCGKKFKEKSHLATHSRAHVDIRNFKCNECGSLFKTKTNLFFHMKTHEEAPFICEKCNKTFAERKILMRHIRVVHSGEGSFNCDQCGRSFKSGHNLDLHYTLHTGNKPFTCNICEKSFVYKSTYTTHIKAHEADDQFSCDLCPSDISDKAELRRRCSHYSEARPWLCTVCGKGYPLKSTLKHHMKTHEPEKPFKCNECDKSFMKKSSYECHLKSHSGENPPYMCDQCSQSYYNVFALKRHYLKHTGERRFICDICNKAFWMKDALKVHKRSHTNVKMFKCTQCSKSFVHKHTLVAHLRTHSGESTFPCSTCPKTFSHKYHLDRHQRQHAMPVMPPPPLPPSFMMMGPPKHLELPTLHIL